jgi:uncharacterized membrane protein YeaQ/YmgE (transglycosylase-associated protein family)
MSESSQSWKSAAVTSGAGVVVVCVALIVLSTMTGYLVSAVDKDDAKLAIATTALGVIGTVVGSFFGIKAANDSRKEATEATQNARSEVDLANQKLVAVAHAADPGDPVVKAALGL